MLAQPKCSIRDCKHFSGIKQPDGTEEGGEFVYCPAFPDGIPDDIAYGEDKHTEVHKDQVGTLTYEPAAG